MFTEKVRIYPNSEQIRLIDKYLQECTKLYDYLVLDCRKHKESTGYFPIEYKYVSKFITKHNREVNLPSTIKSGVAMRVATGYTLYVNYIKEARWLRSIGKKPTRKVKPPKIKNNRLTKSFYLPLVEL